MGTQRNRGPLPATTATSEIDISRIYPEEVLVDAQNVEQADIDETW